MILETQRGNTIQFTEVASVTFSPKGVSYTTDHKGNSDVRAWMCTVAHQQMDVVRLYANGLELVRSANNVTLSRAL